MPDPIIQINKASVIYNQGKDNEVRSLEDASLNIFPEEYIIIYGPSGCGKSTLLYTISGLQSATSGDAIVDGKNISEMTKKEKVILHRSSVGMVFQAFYLIDSLTVLDNVCLPMVFGGEDLQKRKEEGMSLLKRFGIAEQADKFPNQLSGGQKQRAAIARSLINNPSIILADEPVGNLDSESAENVLQILSDLNKTDKKTVVMVTHNAEHLHFANRVIYMKDGKIVSEEVNQEKRPKEVLEKEEALIEPDSISNELKLLMRTFKNFSPQQMGGLLIPYKAKQILSHILSELMEEQVAAAENFLKELMFKNIDFAGLEKKLDDDLEKGGAGWNKQRARSFSRRVKTMLEKAENISNGSNSEAIADYLLNVCGTHLDADIKEKFQSFIQLRLENKIDASTLNQKLDASRILGGIGMYKNTSKKVVKEVEILMLLKFTGKV